MNCVKSQGMNHHGRKKLVKIRPLDPLRPRSSVNLPAILANGLNFRAKNINYILRQFGHFWRQLNQRERGQYEFHRTSSLYSPPCSSFVNSAASASASCRSYTTCCLLPSAHPAT